MILLGGIADDLTGATDLCNTLVRRGMRTVQVIDVPDARMPAPEAEAVVVALKSRTIPAADAVALSLATLEWLRAAGARQILFKYCSTFDSTDEGNIGPVAEALLDALGAPFTIACPAFPENGRTVYQGHLFVGVVLLSESGMRHHPLTPMTDANLVRVLGRQARGKVGLVPYETVRQGPGAIRGAFTALGRDGFRVAVVDATEDAHLEAIGEACADLALVTGGSGIALGLPENFRRQGLLRPGAGAPDDLPAARGSAAVIAGSCSQATLAQVAEWARARPAFRVDPLAAAAGEDVAAAALRWAAPLVGREPVLVYATAEPAAVAEVQSRLGRERAGALVEGILARVARGLVGAGVRRLVVAGGETAGAVVGALGVRALRIGPQIEPGVPWTASLGEPTVSLALKSGNFGSPGFFARALESVPDGVRVGDRVRDGS
jgi:uncharacterized protein YgbK (DUF1537 family)